MLNNILKLEGVKTLEKREQQSIKAGIDYGNRYTCLRFCAGMCNIDGRCFQMER